jgi:hypothetical protein
MGMVNISVSGVSGTANVAKTFILRGFATRHLGIIFLLFSFPGRVLGSGRQAQSAGSSLQCWCIIIDTQ